MKYLLLLLPLLFSGCDQHSRMANGCSFTPCKPDVILYAKPDPNYHSHDVNNQYDCLTLDPSTIINTLNNLMGPYVRTIGEIQPKWNDTTKECYANAKTTKGMIDIKLTILHIDNKTYWGVQRKGTFYDDDSGRISKEVAK